MELRAGGRGVEEGGAAEKKIVVIGGVIDCAKSMKEQMRIEPTLWRWGFKSIINPAIRSNTEDNRMN